ncbi:MAG: RNA polymerase factor sigma-54 [Myxococcota bacterium]
MAFNLRLDTKMSQSLVMTPRLQQAIKLLQYNHQELVTHIGEALLENPALETVPEAEGGIEDAQRSLEAKAERLDTEAAEQQNGATNEIDWDKFLAQVNDRGPSVPSGGTIHDELPPIETNLTYGESLADHLIEELHLIRCSDDERLAAEEIIGNLDERGYLDATVEGIAEELKMPVEDVEFARTMVMELDPQGCGAIGLAECLVIQARTRFPEDPTFEPILMNHLGDLERRNYPAIARALELDLEDVVEYHKMILELEPHPGRNYTTEEPRYITPDVYVTKMNGQWQVFLNEDGIPDLKISRYYEKVLQNGSKEDRQYIEDKLKGATFLIQSIHRRRSTIRRVMESILKFQADFFENGVEHLRPLILDDVAQDIEVHMSTVSRVTSNKYAHTPHGILELKFFFTTGVKQAIGGDMAAEAIKSRIKAMVSTEDAKKPLSDSAIAKALKEDGVSVARRTVAKYREQLGILSSKMRKQMF